MKLVYYKYSIDKHALCKLPVSELVSIKDTSCFLHDEVDKLLRSGNIAGEDYRRLSEQQKIQWDFIEVLGEIIGSKIGNYLKIEDI